MIRPHSARMRLMKGKVLDRLLQRYKQQHNRCSSRKVPMNAKAEIFHKVHESSDLLCSLFAFGSRIVWKQFDEDPFFKLVIIFKSPVAKYQLES